MQRNAVNAKSVDWNELKRQAHAEVSSATSAYEIGPAIRRLYKALNDYHGSFFYKDSAFRWSHNEPVVSDSIRNEWKNGARVRTHVLENKIGYLRIPGMPYASKEDCDARAQNLNDSLCRLLQQNIQGLIIDLRLNGGGAMYPMILGVQQLLQKGQIGSFASIKQEKWYLTDSSFSIDTTLLASIKPTCSLNGQDIPVVLLISPATGSSAEFFLIAFQGRPRTVRLGSETAGFVTGTEGFPIGDTAFVLLSTSYGVDRNGVVYTEAFKPDIPFSGNDSFNDIRGDDKVREAVKWLKKQMTH
jgi:C-terminal processing protease CtpA/Prc